ncbi:hypothetical protein GQR58_003598 [Nymphon striatum]|nr:hypothetical protein GQR58_003598 [Nymphon striatum]
MLIYTIEAYDSIYKPREIRLSLSAFVRRTECLSNAEFNAAIRLRSGVPDLRCLSHIARKHGTDKCRLCKTVKESLGHVMGGCGALSGLITNRHDEALNLIFIELKTRNPEWTFELEPRPAVNVANHKSDLCATHRQSQSVVIMDFTVRTESTSQLIAEAKSDKINKYEQLRSFYMDNGARAFQVMPLFFGARGAIDDETETFLIKKFNLNKNCLEDIYDPNSMVVTWTTRGLPSIISSAVRYGNSPNNLNLIEYAVSERFGYGFIHHVLLSSIPKYTEG